MKKILLFTVAIIALSLSITRCSKDKEQSNIKWSFSVQTDKDTLQRLEIKDTVLITSIINREYKTGAEMFYKVVLGEKTKSDEYELLDQYDLTLGNDFRKLDNDTLKIKFIGLKKGNHNLTITFRNSKEFRVDKNIFLEYITAEDDKIIYSQEIINRFDGKVEKRNVKTKGILTCLERGNIVRGEDRCIKRGIKNVEEYDIFLSELNFNPPLDIKLTGNDRLKKITFLNIINPDKNGNILYFMEKNRYDVIKEKLNKDPNSLSISIIKEIPFNKEKQITINKLYYNDYIHNVRHNSDWDITIKNIEKLSSDPNGLCIKKAEEDLLGKGTLVFPVEQDALWLEIETIKGKKGYVKLPNIKEQYFSY